jgi:hypothetical protein
MKAKTTTTTKNRRQTRTHAEARRVRRHRHRRRVLARRRRLRRVMRPATKEEIAKAMRSMLSPQYSVVCFYQVGLDMALDRKLRKLARKDGDSGMFLWSGIRDLDFRYSTVANARAAAKRIKAARLRGVRVMLRSYQRA